MCLRMWLFCVDNKNANDDDNGNNNDGNGNISEKKKKNNEKKKHTHSERYKNRGRFERITMRRIAIKRTPEKPRLHQHAL